MAIDTPARIAVLGAGPIGLEAALYARYLGYDVDIYERGRVAESLRRWGHVRMFSPFVMNRSPLGLAALKAQDSGWEPPADEALLTGFEFAARYLDPLSRSDLLVDGLHEQTEVMAIGRDGPLKTELAEDPARADHDFRILLRRTEAGDHVHERYASADVVIDTTGTYANPNWLGHGGLPALGEMAARTHVEYGVPDVLGAQRERYASRSILLVGAGYSAATNLVALAELATQARDTWVTWVTRGETDEKDPQPIRVIPGDSLVERGRMGRMANRLAADDANHVTFCSGTTVDALSWHPGLERFSVRLLGRHGGELEFDRIIANVGYRPDHGIDGELQLHASCIAESPRAALAIDQRDSQHEGAPRSASQMLVHPDPDFYILGSKSYGRDSRFLISDGLEQVRELFTILGDRADLDLYATMAGLH